MENASKALIIAGAILISIILISIGIMVVNSSTALTDSAAKNMSEQEIQAFNSKFMNYGGTQKGSTLRALMQVVIASNSEHKEDGLSVGVTFSDASKETDASKISALMNKILPSKTYTVTLNLSDASRINEIVITDGTAQP